MASKIRTTSFQRGGYSFRPLTMNGRPAFQVYPHNERSHWSVKASLIEATDGKTWIVGSDARPSFKEACDLVMARLPIEGR